MTGLNLRVPLITAPVGAEPGLMVESPHYPR